MLHALRTDSPGRHRRPGSCFADPGPCRSAAIGQLVRSLEEWLGVSLFHRNTGGKARLVATEIALIALPDIRAGFDRLSIGLDKLKTNSSTGVLTVAISPAFAAKWLLPRIDKFQAMYPDTDVRLDTNLKPVDFISNGIDIGVRYGRGNWAGLKAEKLMDEEVFPVCSPSFYQVFQQQLQSPESLLNLPLIHDLSMDNSSDFTTWDTWLHFNQITEEHTERGMKINNSASVLQAAIDGRGIALARSVMAHDDLKTGRLMRLYPEMKCTSVLAYYIVYRDECHTLPKLLAFRDWLIQEARS